MPVADKTHTITEESRLCDLEEQIILPPQLSSIYPQLEEILEHSEKVKKLTQHEEAEQKRIEKLIKSIDVAKDSIARSEAKVDGQKRRAQAMKSAVDNKRERIQKSENYWDDYGLQVKQVSPDHYQFIYSKLSSDESFQCCVNLETKDKKISCTGLKPEILNPEQVQELNTLLAQDINYRNAMVIIRKELIKRLGQ